MSVAVLPEWVTLPAEEVGSCHHFAAHYADRSRFARAVASTFEWIVGVGDPDLLTPVSGRHLDPTERAARAEMMLAAAVASGQQGLGPGVWVTLEVPPAEPQIRSQEWTDAVAATLGWLLGVHRRPPLRHR